MSTTYDDLVVNDEIGPEILDENVYFVPDNSNIAARRLMNAMNALYDGYTAKHEDLRRIL